MIQRPMTSMVHYISTMSVRLITLACYPAYTTLLSNYLNIQLHYNAIQLHYNAIQLHYNAMQCNAMQYKQMVQLAASTHCQFSGLQTSVLHWSVPPAPSASSPSLGLQRRRPAMHWTSARLGCRDRRERWPPLVRGLPAWWTLSPVDEQGPGRRGGAGVRGTSYQCYIQWKISTANIVGTKVSVTFMSLDTDSHTRPFSLFSQKHCQGRPFSLYQFTGPKFPVQSILPMVGITHTPDPCPEYLLTPTLCTPSYNLTLTLTQSRLPSPHPHTCSHFIDSGSMSTGGPAMLTVPSQNVWLVTNLRTTGLKPSEQGKVQKDKAHHGIQSDRPCASDYHTNTFHDTYTALLMPKWLYRHVDLS